MKRVDLLDGFLHSQQDTFFQVGRQRMVSLLRIFYFGR